MHELALTRSIVDLVAERTRGRSVLTVTVRVGQLSGAVPDALTFGFELAVAGTAMDGARLEVVEVPGRLACRTCGAESETTDLLLLCRCGSADVEVVAGQELGVVSVELAREPELDPAPAPVEASCA